MAGRVATYLRQNILGLVAIFFALSAGAYAVQKAPKNSVVSKSIKDGEVTSADIGESQVTGAHVDESTLSGVPGANGGTVTSVGSGAGLTGGPVTGTGSLALTPCPNNQLLKSNGSGYGCASDADSGGDITDVIAGNGLVGGSNSGAATLHMPSCGSGSVLISNGFGNGYVCALLSRDAGAETSGTTPSVCCTVLTMLSLNYSAPTGITGLSGGVPGQIVTLLAINGNASIADSGNFFLSANWTPGNSDTLTLMAAGAGNTWHEIARSAN